MLRLSIDQPGFVAAIQAVELETADTLRHVLEQVGGETIAYLRSLTDEMAPPVDARTVRTRRRRRIRQAVQGPLRPGERRRYLTVGVEQGPVEAIAPRVYRGKQPPRPAHPGHWADRTSNLANAYAHRVEDEGGGLVLVLENTMEYAAALEARDGYWVLSGVADPGGPVEQALRRVVGAIAPEWEVVVA